MNCKTKVGVVSLGCDKNRVDTENMLYILANSGYEITNDVSDADVIVINTCAFIESSKKEAISTILEFTSIKNERNIKIIVTGCLSVRYKDELFVGFPEVDAFLGFQDYARLPEVLDRVFIGERVILIEGKDMPTSKRILSTPFHTAYLKIADGCDNRCTYCAIPYIRGKYRSREIDGLVDETRELISEYGIKEINLVAQDITRYGIDIYNEYSLLKLLDKLSALDINWIRLLYCYPELINDDLIKYVSQNEKVCKYLDIPLQHISDRILKMMNRRIDGDSVRKLIDKIRNIDDRIALRSSFIVGFPTETETDFYELCDFISNYKLDYAGFFAYSKEEGTPAAKIKGQLSQKIKTARQKEIRSIQSDVIFENNNKYIGKTLKVLYEGIDYNKKMFYGRPEFCAPEIDSKVLFKSNNLVEIGNFYDVKITKRDAYDIIGETK
ncbi:MAG: 30S ribosomal protein S12 methylthiotransferase RimO [Clostridia bacterium]